MPAVLDFPVKVAEISLCFNRSVVASRWPEVYYVLGIRVKLSFLPGELYLSEEYDVFVIRVQGKEILRARSKRTALSKFNELRGSMEQQFPTREVTPEEKRELLKGILNEALLADVGRRPPKKRLHALRFQLLRSLLDVIHLEAQVLPAAVIGFGIWGDRACLPDAHIEMSQ